MSRERLDVDILIVGGGPAGLSAAIRLAQLHERAGRELSVALVEKSAEPGAHLLSGAVLDPRALAELLPDFAARGAPLGAQVADDRLYLFSHSGALRVPFTPPPLRNHGHFLVSLQQMGRWMNGLAEAAGVDVLTGISASELLMEEGRVVGVRTGDRGVGRDGTRRDTFEPGVDLRAAITILADGVRGNLTRQLMRRVPLGRDREPQVYALGLKEIWEVPAGRLPAGTVWHTLGYPLSRRQFGGGFVYALTDRRLSVGFVAGLDYDDPRFDPFMAFQQFKRHPALRSLLADGQVIRFGAKALPEAGWLSIPGCAVDGALVTGDAAGFLNSARLKGIHLAMKSGMLAADTAFESLEAGDTTASSLRRYDDRIQQSWIADELRPVRHVHRGFEKYGLYGGLAVAGLQWLTGGRLAFGAGDATPGHARLRRLNDLPPVPPQPAVAMDRVLTFDKVTSVHASGTRHEEDQPSHLLVHTDVCHTICGEEYGHPCIRFCPAHVYEMVPTGAGHRLQINASNCVHCRTCDIMDPYQVITWTPPEGGGGPRYEGM